MKLNTSPNRAKMEPRGDQEGQQNGKNNDAIKKGVEFQSVLERLGAFKDNFGPSWRFASFANPKNASPFRLASLAEKTNFICMFDRVFFRTRGAGPSVVGHFRRSLPWALLVVGHFRKRAAPQCFTRRGGV